MSEELEKYQSTDFEAIKNLTDDGVEFWSARDLMPLLGYKEWRYFREVIKKAQEACGKSGYPVENHFVASTKMVSVGYGNPLGVEDFYLTRYACYLIAQNGNPRLQQVADAQAYFASQTIKQEKLDDTLDVPKTNGQFDTPEAVE